MFNKKCTAILVGIFIIFSNSIFITNEVKAVDVISPLPQRCVIQNEYWTSATATTTFNEDVYIGPNAVLSIAQGTDVTVNGNVYVLGVIKNSGNLTVTGNIYALGFVFESSTLERGFVQMLGGNNSIGGGMISTINPAMDIPLVVYEANKDTIVAVDGKFSGTGATLPIMDLYMDGVEVSYNRDGTFGFDLVTNNKQLVEFKTIDWYGNKKIKTYKILNKCYDTNSNGSVDITDLATVANNYNTSKVNTSWQEQYDYNCDEVIDIYDLVNISKKII